MKFRINLFNALLLLCTNQSIVQEVEVFDGTKVIKLSILDTLGEMWSSINKSASSIDILAYTQYIIGLDQYGSINRDSEGLKSANIQGDLEFGMTLSAGDIRKHHFLPVSHRKSIAAITMVGYSLKLSQKKSNLIISLVN